MALKITAILTGQVYVKEIPTSFTEQIYLESGIKLYFKIKAKRRIAPFVVYIALTKGSGYILFSTKNEKPSRESSSMIYKVSSKCYSLPYMDNCRPGKQFKAKYIYFVVDAEKSITATFHCEFGKSK